MKTEVIHIRVKPALKAKAEEAARKDGRSLTNWLEKVIADALPSRSTQAARAGTPSRRNP